MDTIDHKKEALDRIILQYTESPRFIATIEALAAQMQAVETLYHSIPLIADIDMAEGVNLDVIGDIVGVSRVIPDAIPMPYFGFRDTPEGKTFGERGRTGIGARFKERGEGTTYSTILADNEFRLIIRAKIVKNHSVGTAPDILKGLEFIFPGVRCYVNNDIGGMAIRLQIGRFLTYVERALILKLDILPRPAAVMIEAITHHDPRRFFGFKDTPGAKGFKDSPGGGGIFAEGIFP